MKVNHGIWEISDGKGDRHYVKCTNREPVMHPDDLAGVNGAGMYGCHHLKDLAVAILKFEKEVNRINSIAHAVNSEDAQTTES